MSGKWRPLASHAVLLVVQVHQLFPLMAENCRSSQERSLLEIRVILILMKVGILTSTWFQVVPFCSLISEQLLFLLSDDFLRRL